MLMYTRKIILKLQRAHLFNWEFVTQHSKHLSPLTKPKALCPFYSIKLIFDSKLNQITLRTKTTPATSKYSRDIFAIKIFKRKYKTR